jgi:hypothetical protein
MTLKETPGQIPEVTIKCPPKSYCNQRKHEFFIFIKFVVKIFECLVYFWTPCILCSTLQIGTTKSIPVGPLNTRAPDWIAGVGYGGYATAENWS